MIRVHVVAAKLYYDLPVSASLKHPSKGGVKSYVAFFHFQTGVWE
jgi:hypothetical protein